MPSPQNKTQTRSAKTEQNKNTTVDPSWQKQNKQKKTVRTDGPYGRSVGRSVRTVRTDGPYGPSVRTVRTDRPYSTAQIRGGTP